MNLQEYSNYSVDMKSGIIAEYQTFRIAMEDYGAGESPGPTFRPYHLIFFVFKGSGTVYFEKNGHLLHEGDAFIVPAETMIYFRSSTEDPWTLGWIGFAGTRTDQVIAQLGREQKVRNILNNLSINSYKKAIQRGINLTGNFNTCYFLANSILLEIFGLLASDIHFHYKDIRKEHDMLAYDIRQYLDMKYPEKLLLTDVADRFSIHPNHMTRVFRDMFGIPPKKYLQNLRLEKSCQLLCETDLPILLIAASTGFNDQLSFSKAFRKEYGICPTAYRSQHFLQSGAGRPAE